jgi:hypothetical protein
MKIICKLNMIVGGEVDTLMLDCGDSSSESLINQDEVHILPYPYPIDRKPIGMPNPLGIDDDCFPEMALEI